MATLLSAFIIRVSMDFAVWLTIFPYGFTVIFALFLKDIPYKNKKKESIVNVFKAAARSKGILPFLIAMALLTEVSHSITVFLNQLQYKIINSISLPISLDIQNRSITIANRATVLSA